MRPFGWLGWYLCIVVYVAAMLALSTNEEHTFWLVAFIAFLVAIMTGDD